MAKRSEVEAGLEALFRREAASLVRALAVVSGDRHSAADAVQDAFVQAHRHWAKVSGLDNPGAWVRRAAINKIRNQHRGRLRLFSATARMAGLTPEQAPAPAGDRVDVLTAVAALPEQQRMVVALYYLLDQPTSDIAEELDIAEATVRSQLRHARERLGDLLKEVTP